MTPCLSLCPTNRKDAASGSRLEERILVLSSYDVSHAHYCVLTHSPRPTSSGPSACTEYRYARVGHHVVRG